MENRDEAMSRMSKEIWQCWHCDNVVDKIDESPFSQKGNGVMHHTRTTISGIVLLQMREHGLVSKRPGTPEWVRRKFVRSRGGKTKTAKTTCLHGHADCRIRFGSSLGLNGSSAFKF
jgi:hypothetical protein